MNGLIGLSLRCNRRVFQNLQIKNYNEFHIRNIHMQNSCNNKKIFLNTFFKRLFNVTNQATPNPDSVKFYPEGYELSSGGSMEFTSIKTAGKSPLAQLLFGQEGVKRIFLSTDFITVTKDEEVEWEQLIPIINGTLMEFYSSGKPVLLEEGEEEMYKDTEILDSDPEEVAMIKELIVSRVRPAIQNDGGDLTYMGFKDGIVYVRLSGSCSGCPSSSVTLKQGIERMLMHWIPEVKAIQEVQSEEEYLTLSSQYQTSPQTTNPESTNF
jgi:Fe-S cluster biogenesis protein NfuA